MHWNAQVTSLKLRGYINPNGFDLRERYLGVIDVEILGGCTAYAHGALAGGSVDLSRIDLRAVFDAIRPYGVTKLLAERDGKMVEWDIYPAGETHSRPMVLDDLPAPMVLDILLP